ncbi:LolA family protein [Treponema zioleckii]|uniref:LolA family protein n=1 Tax=Treponema zioleckii TaxID=331680 RepID=UPI00168B8465|nr:outer membrane lipoprotein carrier protein LolA [Treponema zioleckii]
MKKFIFACLIAISTISICAAEEIMTAAAFFKSVSDYYSSLRDYRCHLDIKTEKQNMSGTVYYKNSGFLRVDFTTPWGQTIYYDGETLTIYLPNSAAALTQKVQQGDDATLMTSKGLTLMSRYYTVAYESGQDPVPMDEKSNENVIKLVLSRKNNSETFRYIKMSINPNTKLIRRMEGITPQGETIVFNFSGYAVNAGIPKQKFFYEVPSYANSYNDFLLGE